MINYDKEGSYTINLQISIAFLYVNNTQINHKMKKIISFTIATKR